MRLKNHRRDIKILEDLASTPEAIKRAKRVKHLVSWAEAVLSEPTYGANMVVYEREKKVLRDSKE